MFSMTKPITSVALMMLFEDGRFLLSEPVSKYIPAFGDLKVYAGTSEAGAQLVDLEREITIQDLLTQTAGLAYGIVPSTPVEELCLAADIITPLRLLHVADVLHVPLPEMVRQLAKLPLAHQPGTAWRYSLTHDVIGHLISVLSDRPFDVFLQEWIFQPLGLDDTDFACPRTNWTALPRCMTSPKRANWDWRMRRRPALSPMRMPLPQVAEGWSPPLPITHVSRRCCSTAARWMASACWVARPSHG